MKNMLYFLTGVFFLNIATITANNASLFQNTIPPIDSTELDTFTFFNSFYEEVRHIMTIKEYATRMEKIKRHKKIETTITFDPETYKEVRQHWYYYDDENKNKAVIIYQEKHPDYPPLETILTYDQRADKEVIWYRYHKINGRELSHEERLIRNQKIDEFKKIKTVSAVDPKMNKKVDHYIYHYKDGRTIRVYKYPIPNKEPIEVILTMDKYYYLDCPWYRYEEPKPTKIQEFLIDLSKLEKLDSITLKSISKLSTYKDLGTINICPGVLDFLPESIRNLENLRYLNIQNNQFTKLPESLKELKKLKNIIAGKNKFPTFPNVLRNHKNIDYVKFDDNQITKLPDWLPEFENLTYLSLTNNHIEELPNAVGNFKSLYTLNLGKNKISKLPESIDHLTSLRSLLLNDNNLKSLPKSFGLHSRLTSLTLSNNQLTTLPDSMAELNDTLRNLYLKGNNFSEDEKIRIKEMLPRCKVEF